MSQLYGVVSHATIGKILNAYDGKPFCNCCTVMTPKCLNKKTLRRNRSKKDNSQMTTIQDFNIEMFHFLQRNHLSVHAIEKTIQHNGIIGRVDGIFQDNMNRNRLFIIDWKFSKFIPTYIKMDHVIQLNLYMYIMKKMKTYATYNFDLYCIMFSSQNNKYMKIFKCNHLPEKFIENLITKSIFRYN